MSSTQQDIYSIYALANQLFPSIPYVGLTNNLKRRYKEHLTISSKHSGGYWIQELLDLEVQPLLLLLDTDIPGLKLASRYEAYWIDALKSHNVLQNISKNPQTDDQKVDQTSFWHWHLEEITRLPKEERMQLAEINAIGLRRYSTRYCHAFATLYLPLHPDLCIDIVKHRVQLAEVALALCSIPTIEDENEELRKELQDVKRLCIEEGIDIQTAIDRVTWEGSEAS